MARLGAEQRGDRGAAEDDGNTGHLFRRLRPNGEGRGEEADGQRDREDAP
jgi:hypothetical protein